MLANYILASDCQLGIKDISSVQARDMCVYYHKGKDKLHSYSSAICTCCLSVTVIRQAQRSA